MKGNLKGMKVADYLTTCYSNYSCKPFFHLQKQRSAITYIPRIVPYTESLILVQLGRQPVCLVLKYSDGLCEEHLRRQRARALDGDWAESGEGMGGGVRGARTVHEGYKVANGENFENIACVFGCLRREARVDNNPT